MPADTIEILTEARRIKRQVERLYARHAAKVHAMDVALKEAEAAVYAAASPAAMRVLDALHEDEGGSDG